MILTPERAMAFSSDWAKSLGKLNDVALSLGVSKGNAAIAARHPEERLALGEDDPHPLADRVRVFVRKRENVAQEAFDGAGPSVFPAIPLVSSADSPSPPKAPRRAREGRW
jgi:hypothetical protein